MARKKRCRFGYSFHVSTATQIEKQKMNDFLYSFARVGNPRTYN